jgi:disulfide bond formation protein DsbB
MSSVLDAVPVMVVNRFLGLLAVVALAVTVGVVVLLVRARRTGDVPAWAADVALPLAAAIALVTTLGSLYYSEVAGYPPCILCWYQRIAIYPQVIVLGVAARRRDREVWRTAAPLALVGIALSSWHVVIERYPALAGPCDPSNPCTLKWVEEFGLLTIPTMAWIAGVAMLSLTLLARAQGSHPDPSTDPHPSPHRSPV